MHTVYMCAKRARGLEGVVGHEGPGALVAGLRRVQQ